MQAPSPLGGGVPPQRRGGLPLVPPLTGVFPVGMTALGHPWLPQRRVFFPFRGFSVFRG
ncbi:MAG: hypothetical protein FWH14_04035 [Oscillospiraceae bacterium]|nr:hypothetical protein [Oscillospiraceae bacterium]